jgi:hypothetical protein
LELGALPFTPAREETLVSRTLIGTLAAALLLVAGSGTLSAAGPEGSTPGGGGIAQMIDSGWDLATAGNPQLRLWKQLVAIRFEQKRARLILMHVDGDRGRPVGWEREEPAARERKTPAFHNPPPKDVKGRVLAVEPTDPGVVRVSAGTDAGIRKGHTLEVYRLKPRAEYLGRLLIIEVTQRSAVGRLMREPGERKRIIKVGDEVASKIQ